MNDRCDGTRPRRDRRRGQRHAFSLAVSDTEVDDLHRRLQATRWPDPATVEDWSQGVPLPYLQELCRYWAKEYDWPARQARLRGVEQFRTELDGMVIHLLHVCSPQPQALPLVLTHGWPGAVWEFLDVLGPLTDPGACGGDPHDAFSVVALFPRELFQPVPQWAAEQYPNIRLWREHDAGGHFAAMEQPERLVTTSATSSDHSAKKNQPNRLIGTETSGATQKTPHRVDAHRLLEGTTVEAPTW